MALIISKVYRAPAGQESKKLGKFLGEWNGEAEAES